MNDFLNRPVRIGDYCYKLEGTRGSIWTKSVVVESFTKKMVKIFNRRDCLNKNELNIQLASSSRLLVINDSPNKNKELLELADEFGIRINEDMLPIEKII